MSSKMFSDNSSLPSRKSSHKKRKRKTSMRSVGSDRSTEKEEITSMWYWSNYIKTLMWRNKHEVAVWRSYAASLEYERMCLLQELHNLGKVHNTSEIFSQNHVPLKNTYKSETEGDESSEEQEEEEEEGEEEEEEIEFVMSEEMIKFFEQSFRHKLEMKKLKEKEVDQFELDAKELKEAHELREKEMKLLYGEGSCMILGMETAVQLSFEKYCDLKSPNYWPNIPLNL